jgi:cytochrome c oxidase assembly protein subunit 15
MIIANDTLWVANQDFTSSSSFSHSNWHKYPKHNYATFNATQTWIEYINRLATGVLGFPCMLLLAVAFWQGIKKKKWATFWLALFTVFGLGFEAWLGKLVVDGNLKENSITYHMLGTMVIIALLIAIIFKHSTSQTHKPFSIGFKTLAVVFLVLSVVQVILGTQVREEVDVIAKNIDSRDAWISQLSGMFIIHRSFAYALVAAAAALYYMNKKHALGLKQINWLAIALLLEIAGGVVLSYLAMPRFMQPLHLLLGIVLFAIALYIVLKSMLTRNAQGSL